MLPSIFPREGSFIKLIVFDDIAKKIKLTQDEIIKYELLSEGEEIRYNIKTTPEFFDITFTDMEIKEMAIVLTKLSKEEHLPAPCLNLYRLFVTQ